MYFIAAKLARASCYGALNYSHVDLLPACAERYTVKYPERYADFSGVAIWRGCPFLPLTHDTRAMATHADSARVLYLGDQDDSALEDERRRTGRG